MAELPFADEPGTAETRRTVLAEIARVQALFDSDASQTFDWHGTPHWIDRKRRLAFPLDDVKPYVGLATVPAIPQTADLLQLYGGEDRYLDTLEVVEVFSWLVSETLAKHSRSPGTTHVLNLFMAQPLVNPAFGPLSWVALSNRLDDEDESPNLMTALGPMSYDMSRYPASRADAAAVRSAQADFFRARNAGALPADWAKLPDDGWATACNQLVVQYQYQIEANVFGVIAERADLIRRGVRDR